MLFFLFWRASLELNARPGSVYTSATLLSSRRMLLRGRSATGSAECPLTAQEACRKNGVANVEVFEAAALRRRILTQEPGRKPPAWQYDVPQSRTTSSSSMRKHQGIRATYRPLRTRPGGLVVADNMLRRRSVADNNADHLQAAKGASAVRSEYERVRDLEVQQGLVGCRRIE